jgi:hypothetical protein
MYRDDVEALYTRATVLEHELEVARRQLAERDRELATWRSGRPTRSAPRTVDADEILERLQRYEEREEAAPLRFVPPLQAGGAGPPVPPRHAGGTKPPPPKLDRAKVLERARDALGALDDEPLLMVAAVIETLGDEHDIRTAVLDRVVDLVRWINEIRA